MFITEKTAIMSDYAKHVYTPLEVANAGYNEAERAAKLGNKAIPFPTISGVDCHEYIAPFMPWEIIQVLGQTHNGKSTTFDWLETEIAAFLKEKRPDECLVHVSLEENLEAMAFYQYSKILKISPSEIAGGQVPHERMIFAHSKISGIDIFRIADSSQEEDTGIDTDIPLTLSNIYKHIKALQNGDVTGQPRKVAAVFIDYLQALPFDDENKRRGEDKRRLQVRDDVYRMRKMTTHIGCPIFCAVQAKQQLTGNNPPFMLPGLFDGKEASEIGERFDRTLSIWMPKTSYTIGSSQKEIGTITEEMFWLKAVKQRGGFPSGKAWELKWDFHNHKLVSPFTPTVAERDAAYENARYGND